MNDKELLKAFIQFLTEKSGAKSEKDLEDYIKSLGEDGLKKAYEEFTEYVNKQTQKAAHGAKLQYFKKLKNKCADDEELVYYKKGGRVGCGCKKKEEGGEINKSQNNPISNFKNRKKYTKDLLDGREPVKVVNGVEYYINGDGEIVPNPHGKGSLPEGHPNFRGFNTAWNLAK